MWKSLLQGYEKVEDIITCVAMVCGVGLMFVGVVSRYVFNHPLTFVDEIGPIFIVWSTLIGYSVAMRNDDHIKMDVLYEAIKSPRVKRMFILFSYVCGILFSLFMAIYGYSSMAMQFEMGRVTPILEFPVWIAYLIIPYSGIVLVVRYISLIVRFFHHGKQERGDQ